MVKSSATEERCSRCHLTSSSALRGFLPAVPPVLENLYGASSLNCFSCHDGTTIVSPAVDASRTAFHPGSHASELQGRESLGTGADGMPFVTGNRMECVTCHDPHDNGNRPFLRVAMKDLCLVCHAKLADYGLGAENLTGNHVLGTDPVANPRAAVPVTVAAPFRVAFPAPYPLQQGKAAGGWHWDLGGHLARGGAGGITCSTCHAVHGDEGAAPQWRLLAAEPVNEVANLFCEGCHDGARGDNKPSPPHPNPGGTTTWRTYHPVDDDTPVGDEQRLPTREPPAGWPLGGGVRRGLICTTCHVPHGAWQKTPLLRTPRTPAFCEECHEQLPEYHHPVGMLTDTDCAPFIPAAPYGTADGLACAHCHRAHNAGLGQAREADFIPLLRDPAVGSDALCARCHPPENPTCGKIEAFQASHFLGDPSLMETYDDRNPPLRRDPWPESGLASQFAGENQLEVICLSCHSFRKGALVSGDDGASEYLLARSGNPVEWAAGDETKYLCAGCHSVDPATGQAKGHSHPMMKADMKRGGMTAVLPMTATPNGHLNCDSCHRPHEAATSSGRYILEASRGPSTDPLAIQPQVDYTEVCHSCHDASSY